MATVSPEEKITEKPGMAIRAAQKLGLTNDRNIYWSWHKRGRNFGDWIGPYLYMKMTGRFPYYCAPSSRTFGVTVLTAGSIMRHTTSSGNVIVWGSGIISRDDTFSRPLRVAAVRGPYTRDRIAELGYEAECVFGDPAILVSRFYKPAVEARYRAGIVPHISDYARVADEFSGRDDILVVDVDRPVERVIDGIRSCETILSSSLHGLIIAHAYDVPAAWINAGHALIGDNVKFLDYYASGNVADTVRPIDISPAIAVQALTDIAREFPQPDIAPLVEPLWQSCPFAGKSL